MFDPVIWLREARCTAAVKNEGVRKARSPQNYHPGEMTRSAKRTFSGFHAAPEPPNWPYLNRPYISIMPTFFTIAHYNCRVTVFWARVMQCYGWTLRKNDEFSVFCADPIRRHSPLLHPYTMLRRERAKRVPATERPLSCPSFPFEAHHLG